jgi:hypothetical protein
MIFLLLMLNKIHDLPTSWPAPKGTTLITISKSRFGQSTEPNEN